MANRTFLEKAELQVYHPLHFPHSVHIKYTHIKLLFKKIV